jgi:2-(1,2-epoxy-1,2-dihydrophenyl)acetyl-CoA isomerase
MNHESGQGELVVDREPPLVLVTLNCPPNNYTTVAMVSALADALEEAAEDLEVRACLLSAKGKHFSAGANFAAGGVGGSGDFEADTRAFYGHAVRVLTVPLPIVVAVQGAAVGAGLGLALSGDYVVAAERAFFSAPFVRLGIHQGFGLSWLLPERVGMAGARRLLLSGRRVGAHEALRMGLVDEVVPEAELASRARQVAEEIASGAPRALREVKATLIRERAQRIRAVLEEELAKQVELFKTGDAAEGIAASLQRRQPRFTGR